MKKIDVWGWQKDTTEHERGVVLIFTSETKGNSKIIEIVREYDKFYIHKQIEARDGRLFVRLKKRALNPINAQKVYYMWG